MTVYCIVDCKGKLVSAWPKKGIANIHCRTELKDRVISGTLIMPMVMPMARPMKKKAKKR